MKNIARLSFIMFFSLTCVILSCQKGGDDPTPGPGNLVTGNPSVTGIPGATVAKDANGSTFTITVPAGTNVKSLKIEIPYKSGSTISPDPSVARDYTSPVQYTITGSDGSKQTVTVKVEVQQGTKSAAKQITALSFAALSPAITATIDEATHKITASVPANTDITKLVPTITVSDKATVSPASGVVQNFTNAVNYTVKAEDGSTQIYEVKVEKATVGNDKACLLTRIDISFAETQIIAFEHDASRRVSKIALTKGNKTSTFQYSYNSDGEVTSWKNNDGSEERYVYTNGKITQIQSYKDNVRISEKTITEFGWKLSEQNQITEVSEKIRVAYTNGNATKIENYDSGTKKWETLNLEFDSKNNFLSTSKPKGIATYLFCMHSEFMLPSYTNNMVKTSSSEGYIYNYEYTYNSSGFPLTQKEKSFGENYSVKFTYSNCP